MSMRRPTRASLAQWVRGMRAADTYMPQGMLLPLCAGCLVLFGFFAIAPSQYRNLPPLLAKSDAKDPAVAKAARTESPRSRELAVRALGMEANGGVAEVTDSSRTGMSQKRVAVNILIRSGFLRSACTDTIPGIPPQTFYQVVPDETAAQCARLDPGVDADEAVNQMAGTASELALAAVAVEKFHRNALHRRLEWAYVRAYATLFGRLPDVSLGPAQIRIGSVRRIAAEIGEARGPYAILRGSDKELTETLLDECKSLNLSATMMFHFLNTAADKAQACEPDELRECPSIEEAAAASYAGQRRKTHAVIDYGPVVVSMATMLRNAGSCEAGG